LTEPVTRERKGGCRKSKAVNILITGISGFVGSYLAEYLSEKFSDASIFGTIRWRSRTENLVALNGKIKLIECDLKDFSSVKLALEQSKPDYIFHLAAQSYVASSFHAPQDTLITNLTSELNIFEACRALKMFPIVQIAGSSEEYGLVYETELPIKEENALRPLSPYAVSKVGQDMLGFQYFKSYKLPIIRTRAFNHSGPRRGYVFVESNFSKQVAEMEKGIVPPVLKVGNLSAIRDYTDVRDIVKAYWLAAEKGEPGEVYNICSGKGYAISAIVEMLQKLSEVKIAIESDLSRMRPSDVPVLIGDCSKFKSRTGWSPEIRFEKTLEDILNYWRERVPERISTKTSVS
jgi:GDP-4-dehydro-6-deoxy-D-mannose reductase